MTGISHSMVIAANINSIKVQINHSMVMTVAVNNMTMRISHVTTMVINHIMTMINLIAGLTDLALVSLALKKISKRVDDKKGDKKRLAASSKDERDTKFRKPANDRPPRVPRGQDSYTNFTPLNTLISQILLQIQDDHSLKWPPKLKSDPTRRSRAKYYRFHRDHGHNTDDCLDLKNQIKSLIRRGQLHRYATDREKGATQPTRENRENNPPGHSLGEIKDARGIQQPHDDPLVVTIVVTNYTIHCILIDNGSSADLLFIKAFDKMCIGREMLRPMKSPLIGFFGEKVFPLGVITLPLIAKTSPKQVTVMVEFLVVDCPSTYNIILGRMTLNAIRAVTSMYHLLMQFFTEQSIGELRGDQAIVRKCYTVALRTKSCRKRWPLRNQKGN
ncbi:uncharacterized protein LOC132281003 [Cornus florida]|uniref:uncharacterized protein LOC132281003 n=1 Tax=Cornus florida TaxID=4283 RepID=UPI0028A2AE20|nr:uncharacterized protein LOC132281003 [Cornus florida]